MSILSNQKENLLKQAIQSLLDEGISPTADLIEARYEELLSQVTLGSVQSTASNTSAYSESSASAFNNSNQLIKADLDNLYQGLLETTDVSMRSFDRWKSEIQRIDSRLNTLQNRISSLLLLHEDTEGYFNFVSDNFQDTSKIDLPRSSVVIDLGREVVTLGSSNSGATRRFLNNLKDEDISFAVVTQRNLHSINEAPGSSKTSAFSDLKTFWQSRVYMNTPGPVVAELKVKLGSGPVSISQIRMKLHAANSSSSIQITPLYSTDNFEFKQLPTETFSLSVTDKAEFSFDATYATWIKFLMVKEGYDTTDNLSYVYEFGFDEVSFYAEGYNAGTNGTLVSLPLSVVDHNNNIAGFNEVALEACELIPTDTTISYSVAATETTTFPSDDQWVSIDPVERESPVNPVSINFADLIDLERGSGTDSSKWIKPSYNLANDPLTFPELSNPAASFTLLDISGTAFTSTNPTATGKRFVLPTNHDAILDTQFKTTISVDLEQTIILRNSGLLGNKALIRNVQAGWGFDEPYYSTVIEVKSKDGQTINFGDKAVIIDSTPTKGITKIPQGFHKVLVHKNNWLDVANNITTLSGLKAADKLYPYNHKLLIEGYQYDNTYTEEKLYVGVDVFAEVLMKQVSPFDMFHNVDQDDYFKYAWDLDIKDGARDSSRVIMIKIDATNPDFQNERFVVRLKANTGSMLFNYVWLKAKLETNNLSVAPVLDSYRIKLGK